jgi:MspA
VLKSFRSGVIVVVLLCLTLGAGVAVADPPNLEDVHQSKDYPLDGWRLHVSLENMNITSVPNMAATAFTREAFISATATVAIEALDPNDPAPQGTDVSQRSISLWLQEGCQANLSSATLSDNNTSSVGLGGTFTNTGASSISPSTSELPNPSIQGVVLPGTIIGKNLLNKAYPDKNIPAPPNPRPPWVGSGWSNDKLVVSLQNWNTKIDGCGGPVSIRFHAEALMSTPHSDDGVDAYSAIVQI